jgi:hypothetical protein
MLRVCELALVPAPERRVSACRRAPRDDKPVAFVPLDDALGDDVRIASAAWALASRESPVPPEASGRRVAAVFGLGCLLPAAELAESAPVRTPLSHGEAIGSVARAFRPNSSS